MWKNPSFFVCVCGSFVVVGSTWSFVESSGEGFFNLSYKLTYKTINRRATPGYIYIYIYISPLDHNGDDRVAIIIYPWSKECNLPYIYIIYGLLSHLKFWFSKLCFEWSFTLILSLVWRHSSAMHTILLVSCLKFQILT